MKRVIVVLLLLSLAFFSFASDVRVFTAYGEGATENDAKERAVSALAEMVFPVFFKVERETSQYSEENNGSVTQDTFSTSSKTKISVVGEFPYFEYEVVSYSNDVFLVRAEIKGDEKTLTFYKERADNERKTIEGVYSRYKESEKTSGSTRELIEALDNVLEHYPVYKLYRDIFVNLGGESASIALLDDFPTYDLLQYDKRALKIKEQNEISAESFSYELEERIEKNKAEQEALKLAQKENREREKLQNEMETGLALKDATASFENDESVGAEAQTGSDLDGFRECFGVVMRANYNLSELLDLYESKREEEANKIEKSFEVGRKAIETRPYPSGLVDHKGNPTPDALKIRQMEIDELREEKDREKEDIYKIIDEGLCSVIQEKYDYLINAVKLLEGKEFHLSSKEGDFEHYIAQNYNYDGSSYCWYSYLIIGEPFVAVEEGVKLSYHSLTGKSIPVKNEERYEYLKSEAYSSEINEYTKALKARTFDSTLSFSVSFDKQTCLVKCIIKDLYVRLNGRNCLIDGFSPIFTDLDTGNIEWRDLSSYSWLETEESRAQAEKEAERKAIEEDARKKEAEEARKKEEEEKAVAAALLEEERKREETKKRVTVETIEVERIKEKEPVKLSLYLDVRTFLTFGGSYDERTSGAFEIKVEPDLFIGDNFFFGAALYLSLLYPEKNAFSTNAEYSLLGFQAAFLPSIGVKLFERATLSLRMGIVNGSSFLIAPDIAIDLYDHSNESAMPLVISGGCMVNTSTGKVSFSIGFGAFGPL